MNKRTNIGMKMDYADVLQSERSFHPTTILTVIHDRVLYKNGISEVHDLIEFLTGLRPFTSELPGLCRLLRPGLIEQCRHLAAVNVNHVTHENYEEWRTQIETLYGVDYTVYRPLTPPTL